MEREWELQAACRTVKPDVFFSDARTAKSQAKAICKACPVREACLDATLERERAVPRALRTGTFAALSGQQRWDLDRARQAAAEEEHAAPAERPQEAEQPRQPERRKSAAGRPLAECGTRSAYQRHLQRNEPVDPACRAANARSGVEYRRTGSSKVPAAR
ncbi:WhiB family transcriptional regulator [Streptomyces sp. NPDC048288]|uniref:WhiB family transcriptional regulator n=1 Tax=Streptomyces sp. NPDC048288 TaxID=3365529 RepID=UPI003715B89C